MLTDLYLYLYLYPFRSEELRWGNYNEADCQACVSVKKWNWNKPTYVVELKTRLTDIKIAEIDPSKRMADVDRKNNKLELIW